MTPYEHDKESKRLKAKVTRLGNKAKRAGLLADKLKFKLEEAQARDELRKHRLNYFELTGR